jgi:methionine-rich copper-binding protein CopC
VKRILAVVAVAVVLGAPGAALAHGDVETTDPADGDHVVQPPTEVEITFGQPPTADSKFEVEDGCDQDVLADVRRDGATVALQVSPGGSTGSWMVRYRVISATDGHLTRGNFAFLVGRGPLLCDDDEPEIDETPGGRSPGGGAAAGDSDGSDFPIVPVVVGGGVILALAVAVRMMSAR